MAVVAAGGQDKIPDTDVRPTDRQVELLVGDPHLFLGALELGDVLDRLDRVRGIPGRVALKRYGHVHPYGRPVFAQVTLLQRKALQPAAHEGVELIDAQLHVIGMRDLEARRLPQLLAAVPHDLAEALVDADVVAGAVHVPDADGCVIERPAEARLALAERLFGLHPLGDVLDGPEHAHELAALIDRRSPP